MGSKRDNLVLSIGLSVLSRELRRLKPSITSTENNGLTHTRPLTCGFDRSVRRSDDCTGNTKVVGLNPVQSLEIFQVSSTSAMAAFASVFVSTL